MKSKTVLLSEIGEFKNGLNFNRNDYGIGYPIINVKQLYKSRFVSTENLLEIKSDFNKNIESFFVKKGDLLFVRGSMVPEGAGQVAIVNELKEKTVFSGFIIRFRIIDKTIVNALFLQYLLGSPEYREMFVRIASGSVHSNMTQDILGNISVELPSILIQNKITKILDDLDTKIQNLQDQNKVLEQTAQAIFKSWFVNFDGVTEFEDSELGQIPKGWTVSKLGSVLTTKSGGTPSRNIDSYWSDGTINWINSGKVRDFRIIDPKEMITKEAMDNSNTKLIPKKTTVIAITGATLGQVSFMEIDSCVSQNVVAILEKKDLPSEFIYFWFKHIMNTLMSSQTGGAQQHINKKIVDDSLLMMPDKLIIEKFKNSVNPFFEKIVTNCFEIQNLKKNIDNILPKLMSGEIRV